MTNDGSTHTGSAGPPEWEAIARFVDGECSADEAAIVRRWLDEHPEDRALVEQLSAASVLPAACDVDVEAALLSVHGRMAQSDSRPMLSVSRGANPRRQRAAIFTVTAAAAAAAAAVFVIMSSHRSAPVAPTVTALAAHTYTTRVGQRDSVLLADGSRVVLGPDSRLVVPGDYGVTARSVSLNGDGYFDVRHDGAKPFTVRVGQAIVEDIGTTFTVESDAANETTVAVMTGSVRLRSSDSPANGGAVLAAGDRGSLSVDGRVTAHPHAVVEGDAAWITGKLVFRDAPLAQVSAELRRWYGVELHVSDSSLLARRVTASFNGETADQVLRIIGLTLGARIDRHGDSALVTPSRGAVPAR
jgi:transmembrane sensor